MDLLEAKLDRILEMVADVRVNLAEQGVVLKRNTDDLELHMQRTAILEDRQAAFEKKMEDIAFPARALKFVFLGVVGVAAGITAIYGVLKLFGV